MLNVAQQWFESTLQFSKRFIKKHPLRALIIGVLGYIVLFVGGSLYANALVYDYITPEGGPGVGTGLGMDQTVIGSLIKYDSGHFLSIAREGYDTTANAAFLPLYPMLIRGAHAVTGLSYEWSALVVSWIALVGAALVLFKWLELELKVMKRRLSPWLVLGLLAIFPTSIYYVLAYSESIFLLTSLGAIYAYRKQRYVLATALAALAGLTRYPGLVLAVFFFADYLFNKTEPRSLKRLIPIAGPIIGFGAYMLFLWHHYGSPTAFITAQQEWGRLEGNFVSNIISTFQPLYLWYLPVVVVGLWAVKRYMGWAYFLYSLAFVAQPIASGSLVSINRYVLSIAPVFLGVAIVLYATRLKHIRPLYIASSALLYGWALLLFVNHYWVA
jgi:Gpi18-like mannosyltransferase